jgi:rod shape-determining protein MreC
MARDRLGRAERRRGLVLPVLLALTLAVVLVDLAGVAWTSRLREGGAVALGPVLRGLSGGDATVDRLARERNALADDLRRTRLTLAGDRGANDLLAHPALAGARLVPARVVGIGAVAADGAQRLTIDVGSRDGVGADLSVVSGDGLVGRVVEVGPWTSDVLLLGAQDAAVGVRVGGTGRLGLVGGAGTRGQARGAGELGLSLVEPGSVQVGDAVTTLGSPTGRPFVAGLRVGTVTRVDPQSGRLTGTAVVAPTVDLGTLDVVAVVRAGARTTPRPSASGAAR